MEALHLGCVGLAAAGACCTAAARPRALPLDLIGAALMVLAMIDTALHLSPVPTAGWALLLLITAVTTAARHSPSRTRSWSRSEPRTHGAMIIHRNIGTILMAALLISMDAHHSPTTTAGHASHTGNLLTLTLGVGVIVYTTASLWWITNRRNALPAAHRIEAALMAISVLLMGITGLA